jgi:NADH-quinone oxidoreductase subunit B
MAVTPATGDGAPPPEAVDLPMPRLVQPGRHRDGGPGVGGLQVAAPHPLRLVLNWGRRYSLWVFNFGLACCAIEFIASSMARHDFIRLGVIPFAHGPRQADLMIVSGTVTDKMAPAVRRLYEQMPEPKYVISFGACSNSGGPYWDSYCVTKGVDQVIPVDVYVPGCPPRPEALLQGIIKLQEKIGDEDLGQRYSPRRTVNAAVASRPLIPAEPAAWVPPEDAPGQDVNAVAGLAGTARPAGRFPAPRKEAPGAPRPEVAETPTVQQPAVDKPAVDKPAVEKPAVDKPS